MHRKSQTADAKRSWCLWDSSQIKSFQHYLLQFSNQSPNWQWNGALDGAKKANVVFTRVMSCFSNSSFSKTKVFKSSIQVSLDDNLYIGNYLRACSDVVPETGILIGWMCQKLKKISICWFSDSYILKGTALNFYIKFSTDNSFFCKRYVFCKYHVLCVQSTLSESTGRTVSPCNFASSLRFSVGMTSLLRRSALFWKLLALSNKKNSTVSQRVAKGLSARRVEVLITLLKTSMW